MSAEIDLEFDVDELSMVFGEPTAASDFDRQYFWFTYEGHPGRSVTLVISKYQRRVGVVVRDGTSALSAGLEMADFVRVLEVDRRTLEVVSEEFKTRFFMSLDGESVLDVSVGETAS